MSLEQALQENTAAVKEFTQAMASLSSQLESVAGLMQKIDSDIDGLEGAVGQLSDKTIGDVKTERTSGKKENEANKPKSDTKKSTAETASSEKGATPPTSEPEAAASALTYDDIKTPFMRILKEKGEAPAREVLAAIGEKTLKDVKPENFQAAYDILTAKEKELFGDNELLA